MTHDEMTELIDALQKALLPRLREECQGLALSMRMDVQKWLVGYTEDVIRQKIESVVEKTIEVRVRMLP